jgi:hypothetical protein
MHEDVYSSIILPTSHYRKRYIYKVTINIACTHRSIITPKHVPATAPILQRNDSCIVLGFLQDNRTFTRDMVTRVSLETQSRAEQSRTKQCGAVQRKELLTGVAILSNDLAHKAVFRNKVSGAHTILHHRKCERALWV